jgi:MFS family permease
VGCRGRPAPARPTLPPHPALPPARPGGEPWRRRTFLSGQAVSLLGDGLAALAIPLLVLDLSRSPVISGLSAASVTVGYLMVGLPAGVLVDRVDPWRVLLLTDALRAGLFAALFGFAAAGRLAVWLVLAIAFAAGSCSVFSQTALAVPRAMLGRVTSGVRVLFLAVDPIGVVIAGTATSALGGDPRPVFLAAGAAVVTAAAAGWLAGLRRARP